MEALTWQRHRPWSSAPHRKVAIDYKHGGLGDAPLSRSLWMPHSRITRRSVSHKIGNGNRNSRRNASDFDG